ncbi:ATPase [Flavobacteriaceae bacterium MHTCC 0001]
MQPKSIQNIIHDLSFQKRKKVAPKKERIIMTAQLKQLFYKEAIKYYRSKNRNFVVDDYNKSFLDIFCKYFAQDPAFETQHNAELRKGLFVYGSNGTGKTSCFEIMQNVSKTYNISQVWVPIVYTHKVVELFNLSETGKTDYVIQNYSKGKCMFDDLGTEKEASNYGKENLFERIMELRYNQYLDKGTKTFITSNLSFKEIKDKYGKRIEDRFYQMFNVLYLGGESRRF